MSICAECITQDSRCYSGCLEISKAFYCTVVVFYGSLTFEWEEYSKSQYESCKDLFVMCRCKCTCTLRKRKQLKTVQWMTPFDQLFRRFLKTKNTQHMPL